MLDGKTVRKLYNKLALKTDGRTVQDLADIFGISRSEVSAAISELASRGLVLTSNDVVKPVKWWDADRIDLFLNVPRMTEEDFSEYCSEIDTLAREMRAQGLPILRPYSNETVIEILIGVGTFGFLVSIIQAIANFVERVTSKRRIPYVQIEGSLLTSHETEIVISAKGSDSKTTIEAFNSVLDKLCKGYGRPATPIRILFLAANPSGTSRLRLDKEIREITEKIRASEFRDWLQLFSRWAVRPDDLLQSLNEHRPHIIHFSGHGSPSEEIMLEDENGKSKAISTEALVSLFQIFRENIRVVVLNACYSRPQAEAITKFIDCAIGISKSIEDEAAITSAASFYRAIGFGCSVEEAFEQVKTSLMLAGITDRGAFELLVRDNVDASQIVLVEAK